TNVDCLLLAGLWFLSLEAQHLANKTRAGSARGAVCSKQSWAMSAVGALVVCRLSALSCLHLEQARTCIVGSQ
ncbi:MAG: hypothetical protein ACKPKO_25095, partial [Candidatus Fonsibacter sp.]